MAERLTEYNKTGWALKLDEPQNEFEARQQLMSKFKLACEKLGKLEDILEKYGIESVEELEKKLSYYIDKIDLEAENDYLKKAIEKQNIVTQSILKDRDAWKSACELACEREDDCYVYDNIHRAYEFYQQAKKEKGE